MPVITHKQVLILLFREGSAAADNWVPHHKLLHGLFLATPPPVLLPVFSTSGVLQTPSLSSSGHFPVAPGFGHNSRDGNFQPLGSTEFSQGSRIIDPQSAQSPPPGCLMATGISMLMCKAGLSVSFTEPTALPTALSQKSLAPSIQVLKPEFWEITPTPSSIGFVPQLIQVSRKFHISSFQGHT